MIEIHDKSQCRLIDTSPNLTLTSHWMSKMPAILCIHAAKPPETERRGRPAAIKTLVTLID